LVDVIRGAVPEVEDEARVQGATQAQAALSASPVPDATHLPAELIEYATAVSPPETQAPVTGQAARNVCALQGDDRGQGVALAGRGRAAAGPVRGDGFPGGNPANGGYPAAGHGRAAANGNAHAAAGGRGANGFPGNGNGYDSATGYDRLPSYDNAPGYDGVT